MVPRLRSAAATDEHAQTKDRSDKAMRLVSYEEGRRWEAGIQVGDRVVPAAAAALRAGLGGGIDWTSVRSIIATGTKNLGHLEAASHELADSHGRAIADLHLGPPVPDAEKILCIGLNYLDHQQESASSVAVAAKVPEYPMVFNKFRPALVGDGAAIEPPAATHELDYEAELAVVIGRTARNVPAELALDYVAGYAAFNDVSARDLQLRSAQWAIGKGFDTSGPMGPALVTSDEIADPQQLMLTGRLNGEVMQRSSTAQMIFPVALLIEYISQAITLVPGDIIATGTPSGVGFARTPPIYLRPGDVFEVEIDVIGTLTNPVVAPRSPFVSSLEPRVSEAVIAEVSAK
jgi:acylpyruvate hydrolase